MNGHIKPESVLKSLGRHMLVDGFHVVLDLEESHDNIMVDAATGKEYIDFYAFFASLPLGFNHPKMLDETFLEKLKSAALHKVANSDIYTTYMADFVDTFSKYGAHKDLNNYFFVSGGALAVENALKTAFDWKVRKNFEKGYKEEKGTKILHFKEAFHGRSGYTMSLTNTDPNKVKYFAKFDWPRVTNPKITFPFNETSDAEVQKLENQTVSEILAAVKENKDDIAAIIIEPIQGEGGDNHFRKEFFVKLREICDEHEMLLIADEVQTGLGATGKMWCMEHFGVVPDIMSFGKKMQVCGIMAGERVNEVESVFKVSSRINSTWGSNLVDMVRAQRILEIIHEDNLVENAEKMGDYLLGKIKDIADNTKVAISNIRGRGTFAAFTLENPEVRDNTVSTCFDEGLAVLKSGSQSIRFRPSLTISKEEIDKGIEILAKALGA